MLSCLQIEDGEIYASINQKDGMVSFHDNPEKYNNPAMLHKIDQEVRITEWWTVKVILMNTILKIHLLVSGGKTLFEFGNLKRVCSNVSIWKSTYFMMPILQVRQWRSE